MTAKHLPEPQAYVDKDSPGIIRFEGADQFDGLLAGTRAAEIVKRWNAHADMVEALKALFAEVRANASFRYPENAAKVCEQARAALAKAGVE